MLNSKSSTGDFKPQRLTNVKTSRTKSGSKLFRSLDLFASILPHLDYTEEEKHRKNDGHADQFALFETFVKNIDIAQKCVANAQVRDQTHKAALVFL